MVAVYVGRCTSVTGCSSVVDVVLMLDLSGSVEYQLVTELGRALVLELQVNTDAVRVGVVTFSDNVSRVIALDAFVRQQSNLIETLNFQQLRGKTNIQVRSPPHIHGYLVASFPHFNATGSVDICVRKSTE